MNSSSRPNATPDVDYGFFSKDNPNHRLNIGITVGIILILIAGCLVFFVIRNRTQASAPAKSAAPAVIMATGGDLRICPDSSAKITFEDADKENPLWVNEIAFVNGTLWLNLSTETPLFGWAKAADVTYESGEHPSKDDKALANVQILDKTCAPDELMTVSKGPAMTKTPTPKQVLTFTPVVPNTFTPIVTVTPTLPTATQEVILGEYLVPGDFAMLPDGNGVSYTLSTEGSFEIQSSYGQTVIVAAGNMVIDGEYFYTTNKNGTVGNLHVFICNEKSGCKNTVTEYVAGHVRVTIVDGGTEVPNESVAWAVNFMLTGGGNCGNKCLTVNVGYSDDTKDEFKSEVKAGDIKLTEAERPYPTYKPVTENLVPNGASVLPGAEEPTGHSFYLSESPSYTTIPETGGIVVLCAVECTDINGKSYPANTAVVFVGETDGQTPTDLNGTAKIIVETNPAMVMVYVFYDIDMATATEDLRKQYADWDWIQQ